MLTSPALAVEDEVLEVEINEEKEANQEGDSVISLKKYLKSTDYSAKKKEKIRARFKKHSKTDDRIIMVGKKCYINPVKYDYKDLF